MHDQKVDYLFDWIKNKKHISTAWDAPIIRCANGLIANAKNYNSSEIHIVQNKTHSHFYFKNNQTLELVFVTSNNDVTNSLLQRYRTIARIENNKANENQEAFLYYTVENFNIIPTKSPSIHLRFTPHHEGENLVIKFLEE